MFRPAYFLLALLLTGALDAASGPSPERTRPPPAPPSVERFRGGQFQWTRLETRGVYWNRHANGDPALLGYLRRNTALKIDPAWHSVRATSIEALAIYPFIYCDNISYLSDDEAGHLAEYLRRGGFLFIDACENHEINPNIPRFLQDQLKVFRALFPNLRLEQVTAAHEIFSVYFPIKDGPLYRKGRNPQHPMYTVFDGDHLIGIIGLNGYQCGWSGTNSAVYASQCAQMMTNIYVYALTR